MGKMTWSSKTNYLKVFTSQAWDKHLPHATLPTCNWGHKDESDKSSPRVAHSLPQGYHKQMKSFHQVWEGLSLREHRWELENRTGPGKALGKGDTLPSPKGVAWWLQILLVLRKDMGEAGSELCHDCQSRRTEIGCWVCTHSNTCPGNFSLEKSLLSAALSVGIPPS